MQGCLLKIYPYSVYWYYTTGVKVCEFNSLPADEDHKMNWYLSKL